MLETKRLRLEPWEPDDRLQFAPLATDAEMMRYISGGRPWTPEEIQLFADKQRIRFAEGGYCRWKLTLKSGGPMIGFCGMGLLDSFEAPEIGWWVAREHWGHGLASEAAAEALRDARERLKIPRLVSVAHKDNAASIRVMQKIGLRFGRAAEFRGYPVVVYTL